MIDITKASPENPVSVATLKLLVGLLNCVMATHGHGSGFFKAYMKEATTVWNLVDNLEKEALGKEEAVQRCLRDVQKRDIELANLQEYKRKYEDLKEEFLMS